MKALIFIIFLIPSLAFAGPDHPESWYQEKWCKGEKEVTMPDRTRCDCLTETHAIEVDFADKWYQAIGQSLHYGVETGKRPGILLIIEEESDMKYWRRMEDVIQRYDLPVDCWRVGP